MAIHKSGGFKKGGYNRKQKCLGCNKVSTIFVISPSSRKRLCKACAGPEWPDFIEEVKNGGQEAPSAD